MSEQLSQHLRECAESNIEQAKQLGFIESEIKNVKEDLARGTSKMDSMIEKIDSLKDDLKTCMAGFDKINDTVVQRNERMDKFETRMAAVELDTRDNKKDREAREQLRTVIRDRLIWIFVPVIVVGFIWLAAAELKVFDRLPQIEQHQTS